MASRNSDCRIGFIKYAANPSSWQRAPSPRLPAEVSIMIVAVDNSGLNRIRSIRLKPSISRHQQVRQDQSVRVSCLESCG